MYARRPVFVKGGEIGRKCRLATGGGKLREFPVLGGRDGYKWLSQFTAVLAAVIFLSFVGYELRRNNDIAVVQSQYELIALQVEMRNWFTDPNTLRVLMTREVETLGEDEQLLFLSSVTGWFDLFELVYLANERGVLTDAQYEAWTNGLCALPDHWLESSGPRIPPENFLKPVVEGVEACRQSQSR